MKELNYQEFTEMCDSLISTLNGKYDGSRRNIVVPECPYCGATGYKFGIYVGTETANRKPFMSNCFKCGWKNRELKPLLIKIGRLDLLPEETTSLQEKIVVDAGFKLDIGDIAEDEEMFHCDMPKGYSRSFFNKYLKSRSFNAEDYNYFEVGVVSRANPIFMNYVIFPVIENGEYVGYVGRHTWSKDEIDEHNKTNKYNQILRYRNSNESIANGFHQLIYNIDSIKVGSCRTVILVEGVFDVIPLVRKLNLYERNDIAVCATFGKQITKTKMSKLQERGIENVILGYDGDAVKYVSQACNDLDEYFDVLVADIEDSNKDWDDLDVDEIVEIFSSKLMTPVEYNFKKLIL